MVAASTIPRKIDGGAALPRRLEPISSKEETRVKKYMIPAIAIVFVLALSLSASASTMLTWNELNGEEYGATVGAHAFARRLEELSRGELKLDLYTDGVLGSEAQSMQGLQMGTLDFFRGNASSLTDYGAELIGATGMPYVFSGMEQFNDFAQSALGQELLDSVEASDCGFVALAWLVEGPRSIFITEQAYQAIGAPDEVTLAEINGWNIRVPVVGPMRGTMEALGAVAKPITYSELYKSLQSGSLDGAENGVTSYISTRFCEVAPYFIDDAHLIGCGIILMSAERWNALTGEQQEWIMEAAKAASSACYEYNLTQEQACFNRFQELGVKLLPVGDIDEWQEACEPLYARQGEAVRAIIERIQNEEY